MKIQVGKFYRKLFVGGDGGGGGEVEKVSLVRFARVKRKAI